MTADGQCWALPMLGRRTSGIDCGLLLPTPCTVDSGSYFNRSNSPGAALRPTLGAMAKHALWPTPTVCGNYNRKGASATSGDGLATWVRERVPTPTTQDAANNGGPSQSERTLNPDWVEWLMGWPVGWTDTTREEVETHDWSAEPVDVPRVTIRKDRRVPRLTAIGNGQVPKCAALAWRILSGAP
jgi:hypothetical protein